LWQGKNSRRHDQRALGAFETGAQSPDGARFRFRKDSQKALNGSYSVSCWYGSGLLGLRGLIRCGLRTFRRGFRGLRG
jgi:hypothetical protein